MMRLRDLIIGRKSRPTAFSLRRHTVSPPRPRQAPVLAQGSAIRHTAREAASAAGSRRQPIHPLREVHQRDGYKGRHFQNADRMPHFVSGRIESSSARPRRQLCRKHRFSIELSTWGKSRLDEADDSNQSLARLLWRRGRGLFLE